MQPNEVVILFDKCEISEVHNGSERYGITADGLNGACYTLEIFGTIIGELNRTNF